MKQPTYTIAVTGNTEYTNGTEFNDFMRRVIGSKKKIHIRTGTNQGTEALARVYSYNVRELDIIRDKDYLDEGKLKAELLINNANLLVVVWDGIDRDVFNIMLFAMEARIPIKVLAF